MTTVLGISAFYHDSAACLVVDGTIVAAAQEERFTRRKHDAAFPSQAIAFCLAQAGCRVSDLNYVAFYEKPLSKLERLIETYLAFAPEGLASFSHAIPTWLKDKSGLPSRIRRLLGLSRSTPIIFTSHHESHAASAFFPSPFDEAAILTLDGVGEWTTTAIGVGQGHRLELTRHLQFPHSLGLLYSAFTYYCGFRVNSGEYKLMGLAPFGQPRYRDLITTHLIDLRPDGSFWLDMRFFNYCQGLTMTNRRFEEVFGGPPRQPEAAIEQRHMDLAASIQAVTEEAVLRMGHQIFRETQQSRLVMAGGVALNCVANGRLRREGPFEDIWIQPAAGDAGGALGAALFVWHQLLEHPRTPGGKDAQQASLLGPAFGSEDIRARLDRLGESYHWVPDEDALVNLVADALAQQQIVGWFQGRMEFGPRALGARSILGDPRSADMQATMNLKVKFRESFRPFAPVVLQERASAWFDLPAGQESPYMMLVVDVKADRRTPVPPELTAQADTAADLRERLRIPRSVIPAVTHVDGTARVQTVDRGRHSGLARLACLLDAFEARTGCPVLVNTSFNVRGEPIVCTPEDAVRCFLATDIDVLVLEDVVLFKSERAQAPGRERRAEQVSSFPPD